MENTKVNVKIYGQEYTIAGDKPEEHITKVAQYVDSKMKLISASFPGGAVSSLATLAAVNVADELFSIEDRTDEFKEKNEQLEKDIQHYVQLWEEAKKSFLSLKSETEDTNARNNELEREVKQLHEEMDSLQNEYEELTRKNKGLEHKVENLTSRLQSQEDGKNSSKGKLREMEEKYKEIESGYFDLQMENIQLKGEIERYKKIVD